MHLWTNDLRKLTWQTCQLPPNPSSPPPPPPLHCPGQDLPLPAGWQEKLTPFQNLLVLRALREEKLVSALTLFILQNIGKHYIDVPPFDLASSFKDSSALTPIIFVLSTGEIDFPNPQTLNTGHRTTTIIR